MLGHCIDKPDISNTPYCSLPADSFSMKCICVECLRFIRTVLSQYVWYRQITSKERTYYVQLATQLALRIQVFQLSVSFLLISNPFQHPSFTIFLRLKVMCPSLVLLKFFSCIFWSTIVLVTDISPHKSSSRAPDFYFSTFHSFESRALLRFAQPGIYFKIDWVVCRPSNHWVVLDTIQ